STFLLRICKDELGQKAVAVTFLPENYPKSDISIARHLAKLIGVKHVSKSLPSDSDSILCKGKMYSSLRTFAADMNFSAFLNASHKDDESEGSFNLSAARHAGVRSPLLESGLSKAEILLLSNELGLPNLEKLGARFSSMVSYRDKPVTKPTRSLSTKKLRSSVGTKRKRM
ncbi:hypothetical protein HZC07_01555, partial [Candidatus Micrarchaeota archaeon]|nr:hypothetical protein [Candidatus Micrarchaeota archaeon]